VVGDDDHVVEASVLIIALEPVDGDADRFQRLVNET
jgi:hypothetical protein